jgi:hypothetical protein
MEIKATAARRTPPTISLACVGYPQRTLKSIGSYLYKGSRQARPCRESWSEDAAGSFRLDLPQVADVAHLGDDDLASNGEVWQQVLLGVLSAGFVPTIMWSCSLRK